MKRNLFLSIPLFLGLAILVGCGSDDGEHIEVADGIETVQLDGSEPQTISFNSPGPWTASFDYDDTKGPSSDFFDVNPKSGGAGASSVTISIKDGTIRTTDRQGHLVIISGNSTAIITVIYMAVQGNGYFKYGGQTYPLTESYYNRQYRECGIYSNMFYEHAIALGGSVAFGFALYSTSPSLPTGNFISPDAGQQLRGEMEGKYLLGATLNDTPGTSTWGQGGFTIQKTGDVTTINGNFENVEIFYQGLIE